MRLFYNLLFCVFFLLSAPYYFWKMWRRGNWRTGFGQRFGFFSRAFRESLRDKKCIWLHAVSVGEVNVCVPFVKALQEQMPDHHFVISTTTATGMGELMRKLPPSMTRIYYPVDLWIIVARALRVVNPVAVILVEAEIWPNFLWQVKDRKLPLYLVNARLSESSFRGYRRFGFLFRKLFGGFDGVGAQSESDAERWAEIGVRPEAISVTGNMKFDAVRIDSTPSLDVPGLLAGLNVPIDAQILMGCSTHSGEEALLARVYLKLKSRFPKLFLCLVPRHMERAPSVSRDLEALGVRYRLRFPKSETNSKSGKDLDCLLVNSTGELIDFCRVATIVFVGKSLTSRGGQNPIEPAALGKPLIFGPNMQNFRGIAEQFIANGSARVVRDELELWEFLDDVLTRESALQVAGNAARVVVEANSGATDRSIAMLKPLL